jgi:chromosome segregation ATPase
MVAEAAAKNRRTEGGQGDGGGQLDVHAAPSFEHVSRQQAKPSQLVSGLQRNLKNLTLLSQRDKAEITSLKNIIMSKDTIIEQLREREAESSGSNSKHLKDVKAHNESLVGEITRFKDIEKQLKQQIKTVSGHATKLVNEKKRLEAQLESVGQSKDSVQGQISALERECDKQSHAATLAEKGLNLLQKALGDEKMAHNSDRQAWEKELRDLQLDKLSTEELLGKQLSSLKKQLTEMSTNEHFLKKQAKSSKSNESEREMLKKEVVSLEEKITSLQQGNMDLMGSNKQLEDDVEVLKTSNEKAIFHLKSQLNANEAASKARVATLESELYRCRQELEKTIRDYQELSDTSLDSEGAMGKLQQKQKALQKENSVLQEKLAADKTALDTSSKRLLGEQEKSQRLASELDDASSKYSAIQVQLEGAQRDTEAKEALLHAQAEKARSDLESKDAQIKIMAEKAALDLETKDTEFKTIAEQARVDMMKLKSSLDQALADGKNQEGNHGKIILTLEELSSKASKFETEVERLRGENSALIASSKEAQNIQKALQSDITSLKAIKSSTEKQLAAATNERERIEKAHSEKDGALKLKDGEAKTLRERCNKLEHDVKRFEVLFSDELQALNVEGSPKAS